MDKPFSDGSQTQKGTEFPQWFCWVGNDERLQSQVPANFLYLFHFLRDKLFASVAKNVDRFLLVTLNVLAFQEILTDLLDGDVLP